MNLVILSRKILPAIPSASGIEVTRNGIFILGDDSPWIFRMNERFEIEEKIQIVDVPSSAEGKIPKKIKPDLEAMTSMESDLLLFGSGSKSPQRDVMIRMNTSRPYRTEKYSLAEFYNSLCNAANLTRNELNIEAAAIINETLFLFNRGKNRIFKTNTVELLSFLEEKGPIPVSEVFCVTLPSLNNIEAGFSGATISPDSKEIIFTASIENTPNWIDDGEVLGSFVGIFPLSNLKDNFCPDCLPVTGKEKNILKIKIESIAVQSTISPNTLHLLLVTDDDKSSSELIEAEFSW